MHVENGNSPNGILLLQKDVGAALGANVPFPISAKWGESHEIRGVPWFFGNLNPSQFHLLWMLFLSIIRLSLKNHLLGMSFILDQI